MTDLLDVNVWIALGYPDHRHHERARRYWFDDSASEIAFCRITALAFLRLTTQPAVMGGDPFTTSEAWRAYRSLRDLSEVVVVDEPDTCEVLLGKWALRPEATPRLWTDAYLAAFAQTGGFRLVSFDPGRRLRKSASLGAPTLDDLR